VVTGPVETLVVSARDRHEVGQERRARDSTRSVRYGCKRTCSHSSALSGPGFPQVAGPTDTRPRSCIRPARRTLRVTAASIPQRAAAAAASSATPLECPEW
jgi:hypothetical protein